MPDNKGLVDTDAADVELRVLLDFIKQGGIMQFFDDEVELPNDYPVYGDYFYIADRKLYRSDHHDITVGELKRRERIREVRCCNWRRYNGTAQQINDLRTGAYWEKLHGTS